MWARITKWYRQWEQEQLAVLQDPALARQAPFGYRRYVACKLAALQLSERQELYRFSVYWRGSRVWLALAALSMWLDAQQVAGDLGEDAGGERAAREAVDAQPDDSAARHRLAQWLIGQERWTEALDELLAIVGRDRAFGDDLARRTVLAVFELCGDPALVWTAAPRLST